jgi:hypothetical protein
MHNAAMVAVLDWLLFPQMPSDAAVKDVTKKTNDAPFFIPPSTH